MRSKSVELLKIRRFDRLPSEETNSTPKHNQISSLGTHAPQCRCNSKNIFKRTYTNLLKPKDNFQGCFQAKK